MKPVVPFFFPGLQPWAVESILPFVFPGLKAWAIKSVVPPVHRVKTLGYEIGRASGTYYGRDSGPQG